MRDFLSDWLAMLAIIAEGFQRSEKGEFTEWKLDFCP
jgi:hypothetical protein